MPNSQPSPQNQLSRALAFWRQWSQTQLWLKGRSRRWLRAIALVCVGVLCGGLSAIALQTNGWVNSRALHPSLVCSVVAQPVRPEIPPKPTVTKDLTPLQQLWSQSILTPPLQHLGHYHYTEASPNSLVLIGSYSTQLEQRFERLHSEAALALMQMIDAARRNGIWLVPISGFRDRNRQQQLFQQQLEQTGSAQNAAKTVAPPGFSEHHTGYAIDLADGLARAADVQQSFVNTAAFEWLSQHAHEFGFELSFPNGNPQGIAYEPWHWRYISSPTAVQLFNVDSR